MNRKASTARRGYGRAHRNLRASLGLLVAAGRPTCARCGQPIQPGEPWDLGHVDGSWKTRHSRPEHRACNRSGGANTFVRRINSPW